MSRASRADLVRHAIEARRQSGRGLLEQAFDVARLRLGEGRVGPAEYYFYRLFDAPHDERSRARFAGYRLCREIDRRLNQRPWRALANDKLLMYSLFEGLRLPYPRLRAVYSSPHRHFPAAAALDKPAAVEAFLRDPASYPFFMKPLHGSYGRGALSVLAMDARTSLLELGSGEFLPLAEAVRTIVDPRSHGYVLQDLVRPHPAIAALCGRNASSARVVVLYGDDGPRVFRAVWKVPTGRNMSDNFMHGETGNLLAAVDARSGRVERVINGVGTRLRVVPVHPERGERLEGLELPDWQAVRQLCLTAASALPGLRLQHWDIALSDAGPVILEVNVEGSMDLHQLAGASGVWDEQLQVALRRAGST
jgi:hypothetical protein